MTALLALGDDEVTPTILGLRDATFDLSATFYEQDAATPQGKFLIGHEALSLRRTDRHRPTWYRLFKKDLNHPADTLLYRDGDDDKLAQWSMRSKRTGTGTSTPKPRRIGKSEYFSPRHAAQLYLGKLCQQAADTVREAFGPGTPIEFRFLRPAYDKEDESSPYGSNLSAAVDALQSEGYLPDASFAVKGAGEFIYEPYGVFYYFAGVENLIAGDEAGATYLVFDVGGSTTDIALVQVGGGVTGRSRAIPLSHSIEFGGDDIDKALLAALLDGGSANDEEGAQAAVERAKVALTLDPLLKSIEVGVDEENFTLTRGTFDRVLEQLINDPGSRLRKELREFLADGQAMAETNPQFRSFQTLDRVFLAGGSSALPHVREAVVAGLGELAPKGEPFATANINPSAVAALGFAYHIAQQSRQGQADEGGTGVEIQANRVYVGLATSNGTPLPIYRRSDQGGDRRDALIWKAERPYTEEECKFAQFNRASVPPEGLGSHLIVGFRTNLDAEYQGEGHRIPIKKLTDETKKAGGVEVGFSCVPPPVKTLKDGALELDGVRLFPYYFYRPPGRKERHQRLDNREQSIRAKVSLRPPALKPLGSSENGSGEQAEYPVYVCIDLGMSNTAVAISAPSRSIPVHPRLLTPASLKTVGGDGAQTPGDDPPDTDTVVELDPDAVVEPGGDGSAVAINGGEGETEPEAEDTAYDEPAEAEESAGAAQREIDLNPALKQRLEVLERAVEAIGGREPGGDRQAPPPDVLSGPNEEVARTLKSIDETLQALYNLQDPSRSLTDPRLDAEARAKAQVKDDAALALDYATDDVFGYSAFEDYVRGRGYRYERHVLHAVWTHAVNEDGRLLILAGPPGTGKTSLVRLLAEFFNPLEINTEAKDEKALRDPDVADEFLLLEPVSPTWFTIANLLGTYSEIDRQFHPRPFLEFALRAQRVYELTREGLGKEAVFRRARRYFACLDEFNLAQPELYLSDLLSKAEQPHDSEQAVVEVPGGVCFVRDDEGPDGEAVHIPSLTLRMRPNLKLYATINADAASKHLSPKVLDRAVFVPVAPEYESVREHALSSLASTPGRFRTELLAGGIKREVKPDDVKEDASTVVVGGGELSLLAELYGLSGLAGLPFGYRALRRVAEYVAAHPLTAQIDDEEGDNAKAKKEKDHRSSRLVEEVICSFFLSKLPGVHTVPSKAYKETVNQLSSSGKLSKYPRASRMLQALGDGRPGQAAF